MESRKSPYRKLAGSKKFFDNAKAIIVDRDPRDIYILAKYFLKSNANWIPTNTVENFIKYHRLIRNDKLPSDSNMIHIRYEDLIYDYENTARTIMAFLELKNGGSGTKRNISILLFPSIIRSFFKYSGLADDIRQIEEKLPEYIYPFEKFAMKPSHRDKPF